MENKITNQSRLIQKQILDKTLQKMDEDISKMIDEQNIEFVTDSNPNQLTGVYWGRELYEDMSYSEKRLKAFDVENKEKDILDNNLNVLRNILIKGNLTDEQTKLIQQIVVKSLNYSVRVGYQATAGTYLQLFKLPTLKAEEIDCVASEVINAIYGIVEGYAKREIITEGYYKDRAIYIIKSALYGDYGKYGTRLDPIDLVKSFNKTKVEVENVKFGPRKPITIKKLKDMAPEFLENYSGEEIELY